MRYTAVAGRQGPITNSCLLARQPLCPTPLSMQEVKAAWVRTRRSFEQAQQRRARKFVVRPSSAPAVAAAQHPLPRPASADN